MVQALMRKEACHRVQRQHKCSVVFIMLLKPNSYPTLINIKSKFVNMTV